MLVGEVGKPHGTAGEVHVIVISDDPARFLPGSILETEHGTRLTVETSRAHRSRVLVKFEGIATRDEAESLRGPLYVGTEALRELDDAEYWHHDLAGLTVVTADGTVLGHVQSVIPGPGQDLLSVATPRGERLVPLVADIVTEVDTGARRVVVDPPEGLLE